MWCRDRALVQLNLTVHFLNYQNTVGIFFSRLFDMGIFSMILVIAVIGLVQFPAVNGDLFQHMVSNLQCSKR